MIQFDFSKCGLSEEAIGAISSQAEKVRQQLLQERQSGTVGFWNLPLDENTLAAVSKVAINVRKRFQNLLVLGIGGSSVGLKALSHALQPADHHLTLTIQESPDPESVEKITRTIDWKKTCITVISKSGNTIETVTLFEHFLKLLQDKVGDHWQEHVVVICEEGDNRLYKIVKEEKLTHFAIPKNVGGRYSVLSAVGLFPLTCLGVDTQKLLRGATQVVSENAYRNGTIHYLLSRDHGKTIAPMMIYSDRLRDFGLWYSQLWAESLGKNGKGQTPLVTQGPQDQHSLAQLFLDGPKDKVVTFIKVASKKGDRFSELMEKECNGMAQVLHENNVPNVTITLPEISEETLGELIMTYQIQTTFTGHLMGVNPYNQPAVEQIKKRI